MIDTDLQTIQGEALGRLQRAPRLLDVVYLRGNAELLRTAKPVVGIVGTRAPTTRGEQRAYDLGFAMAAAGALVVSGGAMGIDCAAHRGALDAGGETMVILGDPIQADGDERPLRVRKLPHQERVTTLTPFGLNDPIVGKAQWVIRNQYVVALSDAIVVVEGTHRSGTLRTADFATDMQVPLWAMPGELDLPQAQAGNMLLAQGRARCLVGVEHLCASLGLEPTSAIHAKVKKQLEFLNSDGDKSQAVITFLSRHNGKAVIDEIAAGIKMPMPEVQMTLLEMQMLGQLTKCGPEFVLTGDSCHVEKGA